MTKFGKLALAAALLCGAAGATAQDLPRAWKPGTVWEVTTMQVTPGREDDYIRNLNTVWKAQRLAAQKAGLEKSYKILWAEDRREGQHNLVLMIEYPNHAVFDRPPEEMDKINKEVEAMGLKAASAADRDAMRKIGGNRTYSEVVLK